MHVVGRQELLPAVLADLGPADRREGANGMGTRVLTTGLFGASGSIRGGGVRPRGPAARRKQGGMSVLTEFLGDLVRFGTKSQLISKLALCCRQGEVL